MNVYVEVVFPLPLARTFTYILPAALRDAARVGARVTAPFGRRQLTGFIVHLKLKKPEGPADLKEILDVLDAVPVFPARFLAFTRKLCAYHYSSWGELLQAALPPSLTAQPRTLAALTPQGRGALEAGELAGTEKAFAQLLAGKPYSRAFLMRKFKDKAFPSLMARLEKKGLVEIRDVAVRAGKRRPPAEDQTSGGAIQLPLDFSFTAGARAAARVLQEKLRKPAFSVSYLQGPAADREAVYLNLIKDVMSSGGRTLFLVPEIALSSALVRKFEQRLGERAAILHSRLTEKQKDEQWRRVRTGEAAVVIGPRSALLAPLAELKLLIADEEQDESFVQAENPAFDARQGLVFRAQAQRASAVLGSATPSVAWYYRAKTEGFLVPIEGPVLRPPAVLTDATREQRIMGRRLAEAVESRLARHEPTLIFLNRKGYASSLICPRCRYIPKCAQCDIALTFHKRDNKLACRYCRSATTVPSACPRCGGKFLGGREPGIEALEEEVRQKFPAARVASFDTETAIRRRDQARVLDDAEQGKVDILLGTQRLAHQAQLPPATLVGILNPEALLSQADYRAGQKTYQDLSRMMRCAGPAEGLEVIIQTAQPDHHSIRCAAAGDHAAFYEAEIGFRKLMGYPPFSVMAEVLFQGPSLRTLAGQARAFQDGLRAAAPDVEILGTARVSVSRIRGLRRVHLLLRAKKKERLDAALEDALAKTASFKAVWVYD
jgi:primosomal protein N' (replication factor Y)